MNANSARSDALSVGRNQRLNNIPRTSSTTLPSLFVSRNAVNRPPSGDAAPPEFAPGSRCRLDNPAPAACLVIAPITMLAITGNIFLGFRDRFQYLTPREWQLGG